jgi:hypothetical protein
MGILTVTDKEFFINSNPPVKIIMDRKTYEKIIDESSDGPVRITLANNPSQLGQPGQLPFSPTMPKTTVSTPTRTKPLFRDSDEKAYFWITVICFCLFFILPLIDPYTK